MTHNQSLFGRRLLLLFILPNCLFFTLLAFTAGTDLIWLFNMALVALATGVCFAYGKVCYDILHAERDLDKADYLALGIFCSWFSILIFRFWSIIWRYFDKPIWEWSESVVGYCLYLSICAAVFHLLAPGAVGDRVPPARWIKIGAWTSAAMLAFMLTGWLFDLFNLAALFAAS